MDQFYCDPDVSGMDCSGWREVDLDDKTGASAAALQYMVVGVWQGGSGWLTLTDANGNWSRVVTLPGASCSGQQVEVRHILYRAHENDPSGGYIHVRFRVVGVDGFVPDNDDQFSSSTYHNLTGSSTNTGVVTYAKSTTPTDFVRAANVYYTLNSAIKEITTWSSNLDSAFYTLNPDDALNVGYPNPGGFNQTQDIDAMVLGDAAFTYGNVIRHELGHVALRHMFENDQSFACDSYKYKNVDGRAAYGCEWGFSATLEGIGDWIAVRSITTNDTNAFQCSCTDLSLASEEQCTTQAMLGMDPDGGADHMFNCSVGYWAGIGDQWSNATSTCVNLETAQGCDCGADCDASEDQANGWRNAVQISRFLWDLIDSSEDSGDDTDLSTTEMVALFEGMPCVGDYRGVDGSCEEQANPTYYCNPQMDTFGGGPRSGPSRDSFNCWDIAEMVPGSQNGERTLNCVQDAPD